MSSEGSDSLATETGCPQDWRRYQVWAQMQIDRRGVGRGEWGAGEYLHLITSMVSAKPKEK